MLRLLPTPAFVVALGWAGLVGMSAVTRLNHSPAIEDLSPRDIAADQAETVLLSVNDTTAGANLDEILARPLLHEDRRPFAPPAPEPAALTAQPEPEPVAVEAVPVPVAPKPPPPQLELLGTYHDGQWKALVTQAGSGTETWIMAGDIVAEWSVREVHAEQITLTHDDEVLVVEITR